MYIIPSVLYGYLLSFQTINLLPPWLQVCFQRSQNINQFPWTADDTKHKHQLFWLPAGLSLASFLVSLCLPPMLFQWLPRIMLVMSPDLVHLHMYHGWQCVVTTITLLMCDTLHSHSTQIGPGVYLTIVNTDFFLLSLLSFCSLLFTHFGVSQEAEADFVWALKFWHK